MAGYVEEGMLHQAQDLGEQSLVEKLSEHEVAVAVAVAVFAKSAVKILEGAEIRRSSLPLHGK